MLDGYLLVSQTVNVWKSIYNSAIVAFSFVKQILLGCINCTFWVVDSTFCYFLRLLIYLILEGRQTERGVSHLPARLRAGARNPVSHVGGRDPSTGTVIYCLPGSTWAGSGGAQLNPASDPGSSQTWWWLEQWVQSRPPSNTLAFGIFHSFIEYWSLASKEWLSLSAITEIIKKQISCHYAKYSPQTQKRKQRAMPLSAMHFPGDPLGSWQVRKHSGPFIKPCVFKITCTQQNCVAQFATYASFSFWLLQWPPH